jgi:uncharacterized protein
MMTKLIAFGKKMLLAERTPRKLALASCIGIFVAFSPLIGLHWLLTIILAWAFCVNVAVVYAAAHIVNNPFTMVPLYMADYAVGVRIAQFLGINLSSYNPWWMNWLNLKLSCIGIPHLSLWAFFIGGNVLGLTLALLAYPILISIYKRFLPSTAV